MKALILIVLGIFSIHTGFSQYFYNDIIVTGETMNRRKLLVQQKINHVQFVSLDGNGQPIDGFSSEQSVFGNGSSIVTTTKTTLNGNTQSSSDFDAKGNLISTTDTTDGNKSQVKYYYNPAGKLSRLISVSTSAGGFSMEEQHIFIWNNNRPEKMLKIKNGKDTTYVSFVTDEQGNIAEEKSISNGKELPAVYYYYDDQHRLTDIVRYNEKARRLLPDYIFEYDAQGRVSSMLVTTEGTGDYQKWYYTYNEKGLKIKDECFSKTKVLIGKIEYQYK
ncbi:hypothetical protein HHL16_14355 [Pseudoflavitalea sp. G-6-1-2]|uniref:hypothetical protein n=1 Tax=Pseudoflavitalea sp. G-6-1-2 TaxID=2728841 RepID=UPI00146DDCF6|nr:hypothetical protein [Pseudoflavitalea sp. G-6-1-2]NML22064.1 hypothetical protein [Pseudoflavitalea sp. G-6-1-2]